MGSSRGEPWEHEWLNPLQACVLLMLAACLVVRTVAVHVVYVRLGPRVAVGSKIKLFCRLVVRCASDTSVLVAMASRVMVGVLGAVGAPSASRLQRSERRDILTKLRSHNPPIVGSSGTCGCTNSVTS